MKIVVKDKVHLETTDVQPHLAGAPWPVRERLQKREWTNQLLMLMVVMAGVVGALWVMTH